MVGNHAIIIYFYVLISYKEVLFLKDLSLSPPLGGCLI